MITFLEGFMRQTPTFLLYPSGGDSIDDDEEEEQRADEEEDAGDWRQRWEKGSKLVNLSGFKG